MKSFHPGQKDRMRYFGRQNIQPETGKKGGEDVRMKKNVLVRTNFLVCIVIVIGFVVTSVISYQSNQGIFRKDMESVSRLTSEDIYHQIDSIFTKPINISLTIANDSLKERFPGRGRTAYRRSGIH